MNHCKKIEKIVKNWAEENGLDMTDTNFHTSEEWKKRGERYCNDAVTVMTTEGHIMEVLSFGSVKHIDSFYDALDKEGYWNEPGSHWMFGFYLNNE